MGKIRDVHKILVRRPENNRGSERPNYGNNIKMDLKATM
jgi:hypothetical protein